MHAQMPQEPFADLEISSLILIFGPTYHKNQLTVSTDEVNCGFVQINVAVSQCGVSKLGMV